MEQNLAAAFARRLGLVFDEATVIGMGMNVLVHLRPAPVVARVTRLAHLVRPADALAGGVGLARHLGDRAVSPSDAIDPGPHAADGRYVTFWTYRTGEEASPSEAGAALRAFHDAGERYRGPLRSFDPRPEALRIAAPVSPRRSFPSRRSTGTRISGTCWRAASGKTSMMRASVRPNGTLRA